MSELNDLRRRIAVLEHKVAAAAEAAEEPDTFIDDFRRAVPLQVFAQLLDHLEKTVPGFSIAAFREHAETNLLSAYAMVARTSAVDVMEQRTKDIMMQMIPGTEYDLRAPGV
jgi:hypothetical protein